jgi:hypothetical protein
MREKKDPKENSMKSKIVSLVVLCALSLCPSVGFAQTSRHAAPAVEVPFAFVVGNQAFPAGDYEFRSLLNSIAGKDTIDVLVVRSMDGQLYRAIVTRVLGTESGRPRVVFTRRGGRAFLSEVWESGKPAGCWLMGGEDQVQTAEVKMTQ